MSPHELRRFLLAHELVGPRDEDNDSPERAERARETEARQSVADIPREHGRNA